MKKADLQAAYDVEMAIITSLTNMYRLKQLKYLHYSPAHDISTCRLAALQSAAAERGWKLL